MTTARRAQSGTSMLEVLVSIVVLTIGALGAAGMQISSLRDTGSASNRFRAVSLAQGMSDSLRADRSSAVKGGGQFESAIAAGACTAADVVPVTRWQNQIACDLPSGKGGVSVDTFTKRAIVTVEWDDSRGSRGSTAQQFVLETRL